MQMPHWVYVYTGLAIVNPKATSIVDPYYAFFHTIQSLDSSSSTIYRLILNTVVVERQAFWATNFSPIRIDLYENDCTNFKLVIDHPMKVGIHVVITGTVR